MIALVHITMKRSGVAGIGRRELREVGRRAIKAAAEYWWRFYLPIHFTKRATRRYKYRPREGEAGSGRPFRGSYSEKKLKRDEIAGKQAIGEVKPLVWSGESRERATHNQNIRATARNFANYRADVILDARAINFVPEGPDELTRVSADEISVLDRVFGEEYERQLNKRGRTLVTSTKAA